MVFNLSLNRDRHWYEQERKERGIKVKATPQNQHQFRTPTTLHFFGASNLTKLLCGFSSRPSSQFSEMEIAVAKALKPSLMREFFFQQAIGNEILCLNANNVVVGGDDFSVVDVDDLLDFSNGEFQHASLHYEHQHHQQQQYDEQKDTLSFSSHSQDDSNSNSASVSIFSHELAVPNDDLAELEWVSRFVDDSLPEPSLLYPVRPEQAKPWAEPEPRACSVQKTPRFPSETKVPTKARTEKSRKLNARACLFIAPVLSRPSSPSSCSSSVASSTAQQPPAKRQKKRAEAQQEGGTQAQLQRRCSHCHVQKTPQWRTGPLGAKTLCNACGVRYKSGRLFDEYRPACSPTFSSDAHSNSHRKVLEIRKRKGVVGPVSGSVHSQLIPSC